VFPSINISSIESVCFNICVTVDFNVNQRYAVFFIFQTCGILFELAAKRDSGIIPATFPLFWENCTPQAHPPLAFLWNNTRSPSQVSLF
jgi:hypothetical protein